MKRIKTSELTGRALDHCVHLALGFGYRNDEKYGPMYIEPAPEPNTSYWDSVPKRYSTDWAQGGPIIEREEIGTHRNAPCSREREWEAVHSITARGAGGKWGYGPTPLIAVMRCFVASKLGDEVEVPKELQ